MRKQEKEMGEKQEREVRSDKKKEEKGEKMCNNNHLTAT